MIKDKMYQNSLVCKTGALGDLIVSTPAIKLIHDSNIIENVELLGSPLWLELLDPKTWPKIKSLWIIDANKKIKKYIPQLNQWVAEDNPYNFFSSYFKKDLFINLRYESLRYLFPALFIKDRVGSAEFPWSYLYNHSAKWTGFAPEIHEKDRNFQVIEGFKEFFEEFKRKNIFFDKIPELQTLNPNIYAKYKLEEKKYALINPTASQKFKAWDSKNFQLLFEQLKQKFPDIKWKIIGSPSESDWLKEVSSMQSEIIQPENIADLYSIVHGSCFLLSNASSMHFFSSIWGIKCLVLMGAANPKIWGPLGTGSHFISGLALQEQLSLKKEWHDLSAREKEIMCYKSIKIESVFDKIKGILSSSVS